MRQCIVLLGLVGALASCKAPVADNSDNGAETKRGFSKAECRTTTQQTESACMRCYNEECYPCSLSNCIKRPCSNCSRLTCPHNIDCSCCALKGNKVHVYIEAVGQEADAAASPLTHSTLCEHEYNRCES